MFVHIYRDPTKHHPLFPEHLVIEEIDSTMSHQVYTKTSYTNKYLHDQCHHNPIQEVIVLNIVEEEIIRSQTITTLTIKKMSS